MLVFCDYNQFPQSWPRDPTPACWPALCRSARAGLRGSRLWASPAQITPDLWSRRSFAPGGAAPGRSPQASQHLRLAGVGLTLCSLAGPCWPRRPVRAPPREEHLGSSLGTGAAGPLPRWHLPTYAYDADFFRLLAEGLIPWAIVVVSSCNVLPELLVNPSTIWSLL